MADIPSDYQRGENFKGATIRRVDGALQCLRDMRIFADGRTLTMRRTASGIMLSAKPPPPAPVFNVDADYDGFFKVVLEETDGVETLSVVDGADEEESFAGYAYYNGKRVECPKKTGIAIAAGYLCVKITKTGQGYTVDYGIEALIPDMPTLADLSDDNTAMYPLARITGSEADGWTVRQLLKWYLPPVWCFGPCDPASS